MNKMILFFGICIVILAPFVYGAACTINGYVFNIGGGTVPTNTPVNVTKNTGSGGSNVTSTVYTEGVVPLPG